MRPRLILLAAVAWIAAAATLWVGPRVGVPSRFWLEPLETVSIAGRELKVVRVNYEEGLREVESLGSLKGALFVLDRPASVESGIGMDDTVIPLDVIFFDPSGRFISRYTMPICEDENCPTFYPTRAWQSAIEGPAGTLSWVPEDAQLIR